MKEDFQFWGEDEEEDKMFWNALIVEFFKEWLSGPEEDKIWNDL